LDLRGAQIGGRPIELADLVPFARNLLGVPKINLGDTIGLRGMTQNNLPQVMFLLQRMDSDSLSHLNLSGNEIGDQGAQALAGVLENKTNLTDLHLSDNEIGSNSISYLIKGLLFLRELRELNLSHNSIGNIGAYDLAQVLDNKPNLQGLYLEHNQIGPIGLKALARALAEALQYVPNL